MAEKRFYDIKAVASQPDKAEVWIYGDIGPSWWEEGILAKDMVLQIAGIKATEIDVHISSRGGSVFDGIAIHNAFKQHPAQVNVYIDSLAGSIATVIALAGDKICMAGNAMFMIHNPMGAADGYASDLRKVADVLDQVQGIILGVYRDKTGKDDAELIALMDAETWMDAATALSFGFIDEIGVAMNLAACADFDLTAFSKIPATFKAQISAATKKKEEHEHMEADESSCPQMPCEGCVDSASCTKPEKTMEAAAPAASATHNQAPQVAIIKEAPAMSQSAAAPAAGAQETVAIVQMCVKNNVPAEKVAEWMNKGMTADGVGRAILDMHASGTLSTPASEAAAIVDMGKDAKKYSYTNALRTAIAMREGGSGSGFEFEIHQEIAKKLPNNYEAKGGLMLPMRVGNVADPRFRNTVLTTGGSTTGAEAVFQEYGEFIDLLRNMACCTRMGARTLTDLRGPITFPKQSGASTAYWVGENPEAAVTQSNPTFGTLTMAPKTLQATGAVSRQLLTQSTPDVEGLVRNDLALVHALAWDYAAMHGTGQNNQPTGIYAASGVNAKAMGGVPTFGKLVDMETELNKDNALFGTIGWCTTPGMAGKLRQTLESASAGSRWVWDGPAVEGSLAGYRAMSSNQCSSTLGGGSNEHAMILGNWADLLIGMWAGLEIIVDPYTLADKGLVKLTSFQMVDIGLRRVESFAKATGATI